MSNQPNDSSTTSKPLHMGIARSISRILREHIDIEKDPNEYWYAYPLNLEEPYEWHFIIKGPSKTEFEGGLYHGRIVLPNDYPFSPPSVIFLTPNGRFEVGKKVCLNASNYHPELWHPVWGLRALLGALHTFLPSPSEGAIHSLDWSQELRKKLARDSVNWTCGLCKKSNQELINLKSPSSSHNQQTSPTLEIRNSQVNIFQQYSNSYTEAKDNQKIVHSQVSLNNESEPQEAIPAQNKRLKPKQSHSSLLTQLFVKPSNKKEMLLLFLDFILVVFLVIFLIFTVYLIVEILEIF